MHCRPCKLLHVGIKAPLLVTPYGTPLVQENATQLESRWTQHAASLPEGGEGGAALQAYLDLADGDDRLYHVISVSGPARMAALEKSVALLVPEVGARVRGGGACGVMVYTQARASLHGAGLGYRPSILRG